MTWYVTLSPSLSRKASGNGLCPHLTGSPYSGYKLAFLVNYSVVLCKCFLTNYTLLGLKLQFAWLPFHCSNPRSKPSTSTALEININGFRRLLLWYSSSFDQSPWAYPGGIAFSSLVLPLYFFFKLWWQCAMGTKCWFYVQKWQICHINLQK